MIYEEEIRKFFKDNNLSGETLDRIPSPTYTEYLEWRRNGMNGVAPGTTLNWGSYDILIDHDPYGHMNSFICIANGKRYRVETYLLFKRWKHLNNPPKQFGITIDGRLV